MGKIQSLRSIVWMGTAICVLVAIWIGSARSVTFAASEPHPNLTYYGPEGATQTIPDAADDQSARAQAALSDAAYFGAYAEGPGGRTGAWTGAHYRDTAKELALAACGAGCQIIAERIPAGLQAGDGKSVIPTSLARPLGAHRSYGEDFYARGGASAWGLAATPQRGSSARSQERALADCEIRRMRETLPNGAASRPCQVFPLHGIADRRPTPVLYPAPYQVHLAKIVETGFRVRPSEKKSNRRFLDTRPRRLHGAFARGLDGARGYARQAGWPEAGVALALAWCDARRRATEPPCDAVLQAVPDLTLNPGELAVPPETMAAFLAWQDTEGVGAFAISPFGAFGTSYGFAQGEQEQALQKAADWCWYSARQTWTFREFDNAFLTLDIPCRIVTIRSE